MPDKIDPSDNKPRTFFPVSFDFPTSLKGYSTVPRFANGLQPCRTTLPEGVAKYRVRGYVVDKNNDVVPSIILTVRNHSDTYCVTRSDKGNFEIYVPAGQYLFRVQGPQGRFNLYQPLTVSSNTSIKFMYFGRRKVDSVSVKLSASRTRIKKGESTVISWSATGADSVMLDGGNVKDSGSRTLTPESTKTFKILAKNAENVASESLTIEVEDPAEPSAALTIKPSKIKLGQPVYIEWIARGATAVTLNGSGVPLAGSRSVYPKSNETFTLTAFNSESGKRTTVSKVVTVVAGPDPDPVDPNSNGLVDDSNTNTDNSNTNIDTSNSNINSFPMPSAGSPKPTPTPVPQYFPSTPFQKLLVALMALALLAGMAWAFPILSAVPSAISSFFGGFGMIGQTDGSGDEVHCTLYSQPEVNAGTDLLVQVFAHLLEQSDELDELAQELDPDAKKALSKALKEKIKRESVLTFKLMVPGIELDEEEQEIVWRGEPESVEFIVPIPADQAAGSRFGRVFVYSNGNEIGKIPFRINIVPLARQLEPEAMKPEVSGVMTQDQTAFVSYASRDKEKVYRFVQLMDVLKYKFHIDIFNIEAGDRWEQKLYEFIGTDDVFLLFWSEAASQSEWVIKEARLAKERMEKEKLPRIVIYNLDGRADIPEWLQDIHVDRKWAEIIGQIEAQG